MIILASKSPRRRELLEKLGLDFTVMTEDVDETMDPARVLETEIQRVSERKARAVQSLAGPEDLIISADTVVCADGRRLGKPADAAEARAMLRLLSGREHTVVSGLCLLRGDRCETASVTTALHFRPLSDREIDAYIATGEPMDKAGAYGIQGLASIFVDRLDGDYYNVMGLPLCTLAAMLRGFGVDIL
ncbi:MAG: septum formation inhibitor Maf [Ruminococcaceae bacterium]|jgi:septum formation protein|nr:septum formation inhibitor Maf [Oscillospiraceae bacterium]